VEVDVDKLKELRRQKVWTIEQLASKASVSKNTISKAERGGSVYPSSVHKIASALGVEPSELVKAS
jgi:transcriptional regulator with XRE-family HTH domain